MAENKAAKQARLYRNDRVLKAWTEIGVSSQDIRSRFGLSDDALTAIIRKAREEGDVRADARNKGVKKNG